MTTNWWIAGPALVVAAGSVASVFLALLQIGGERRRRRKETRVSQATLISGWPGIEEEGEHPRQEVVLFNGSHEPVYQAVASFVFIQGAAWRRGEDIPDEHRTRFQVAMGIIPPGRRRVWVPGNWQAMLLRPGVELSFTDRAGVHWIRRANGDLHEIRKPPFDYYDVLRPMDLVTPEPAD